MRRFRGLSAALLCVSLPISAFATQPGQPDPAATPAAAPAPQAASGPAKDDYYTRRARSVLDAEKSLAVAPHPLAARYPGQDVVVCEGGCPARKGPSVVYLRPQQAPPAAGTFTERREAKMLPTSETGRATDQASTIVCLAGCYADASVDMSSHEPVSDDDTWYPSVMPAPLPPRDRLSPVR